MIKVKGFVRKFISLLLVLSMCLPMASTIFASEIVNVVTEYDVNPMYEGLDLDLEFDNGISFYSDDELQTFDSLEEASKYMRDEMVKREGIIEFKVKTSYYEGIHKDIYDMAVDENNANNPNEGDYIDAHYSGYRVQMLLPPDYVVFIYDIKYLTSYEQELLVDKKVKEVLDELNVYDLSEYVKIKAIHDYIVTNIDYDYSLENHSAYNAIIDESVVCQGFASLTYRMLKELGVGVRYINGYGNGGRHGWNIAKIDDKWYNLDNTWDENISNGTISYKYFLKSMSEFEDHERNSEFTTSEFNSSYPMASESYNESMDNKPIIIAKDQIIKVGDSFNTKKLATATDREDGDITSKIVIKENTVNTNEVGTYKVVYEVEDSDGNKATKEIKVTVLSNDNPIITANDQTIKVGDSFDAEKIATATDKEDGDITSKIVIKENTVNVNKAGIYKVVYEVEDSDGNKATKEINVTVLSNDNPIITASDQTIKVGDSFEAEKIATATDREDGDITSKITIKENTVDVNKEGIYKVVYEVEDSDGNKATKEIKVTVLSNDKPIITANDQIIKVGDSFNAEKIATATDREDGDITSKIIIKESTVNVNKVGTYKVVYEVEDSDGNKSTKEIKVTVNNIFINFAVDSANNKSTTITGKGVSGAKVEAYVGTTKIGTTTVNSSGKFSISIKARATNTKIKVVISKDGYNKAEKTITVLGSAIKNTKSLTKDIYKYDIGKGKYLTYINNKGYSQYVYLNTSGKYAFTPSSWMTAAGLSVSMPTSTNGYTMMIDNNYIEMKSKANELLNNIKSNKTAKSDIQKSLNDIENMSTKSTNIATTKAAPKKSLTKDIYKYDAGKGKYLTYINGKGYSQYSYLNTSGTYAFTPSSWMVAAGLTVSMPTSSNGYTMKITNQYKLDYEKIVKEIQNYM